MNNHISELDFIPEVQSYEQYRDSITNEQAGMSKQEVLQKMQAENESALDLDSLPTPTHRWVDRGLKMSCEGGSHPSHSHYKVRR